MIISFCWRENYLLCKLNYDISLKCVTFLLFRTYLMYVLSMSTPESLFWGCFQRLLDVKNELIFIKITEQSTAYSERLSKIEKNYVFCSSLNIFWWDVNLQACRWCLLILCWITEGQIKVWESQSGWGWMTSGGLSQAGPPRAYFLPHIHDFWIPPRMEIAQSPWATCVSAWSPTE